MKKAVLREYLKNRNKPLEVKVEDNASKEELTRKNASKTKTKKK